MRKPPPQSASIIKPNLAKIGIQKRNNLKEKNPPTKQTESASAPPPGLGPETVFALNKLAITLERMKFGEYIAYMNNTKRLIGMNLVAGLFRGMGITLGVTVLAAIVFYILGRMVDIPIIGNWIANIVLHVEGQIANTK